jgi:hypothetical protein
MLHIIYAVSLLGHCHMCYLAVACHEQHTDRPRQFVMSLYLLDALKPVAHQELRAPGL